MLKATSIKGLVKYSKTLSQFANPSKGWIVTGSLLRTTRKFLNGPTDDVCRPGCIKLFQRNFSLWNRKPKDDEKIQLQFKEFERIKDKNKKTFFELVELYELNFPNRANHVDFIRIALRNLKAFGLEKDYDTYKKIVNILPRGVFVSTNKILTSGMYFPKQQYVILELLNKMEMNGIILDIEFSKMLQEIFGKNSYVCRKFYRMLYWNVKFKNKSPWPLPPTVPNDSFLLGQMAVKRIMSVDIHAKIDVFQTEDVPDSIDKTWIVSGQSPKQQELLQNHSAETPVVVEGGDIIWLRNKFVNYFVLKADCEPFPFPTPIDRTDMSQMRSPYVDPFCVEEEREADKTYSVHEQDDGIIYGVCVTGTSSKDSLLSWVRLLQKTGNPILEKVPVLFRFKTPEKTVVPFSEALTTKTAEKSENSF